MLELGSRVAVVAPSGPFPRARFLPGLAWAQSRYSLVVRPSVFASEGYLAGTDARRLAELQAALDDPTVSAVWAARGGYGATRLLQGLDWAGFKRSPKWLIGFSDITALHLRAQSLNVCSIHGANLSGVREGTPHEQWEMLRILEGGATAKGFEVTPIRAGAARGTLFGGNLSLVVAEAAAGRLKPPEDALWILEDIAERPYRIDRMLTSLLPHLERARGILFGDFADCMPGPDGVTLETVLSQVHVACPVYRCTWFGHGKVNLPLVLGSEALLDESGLLLRWR
jgi:muramoyltetrapeptide carboxypeptidase